MSVTERARLFAIAAHEAVGQTRKYTGEPYYTHVLEVGSILKDFYLPPDVVAAGYLHDTVEDTSVTLDLLDHFFGDNVAYIVEKLTEDKSIRRKERKELTRQKFKAAPLLVRCAKLADMISNTRSLPWSVEGDSSFQQWRSLYLSEQKALLETMKQFDPVDFIQARSFYRESYEDMIHLMTRVIEEQTGESV